MGGRKGSAFPHNISRVLVRASVYTTAVTNHEHEDHSNGAGGVRRCQGDRYSSLEVSPVYDLHQSSHNTNNTATRQDLPASWAQDACANAAQTGHLNVLQWMRGQDPPCTVITECCSNTVFRQKHGS